VNSRVSSNIDCGIVAERGFAGLVGVD
jgi:hypothetical protein